MAGKFTVSAASSNDVPLTFAAMGASSRTRPAFRRFGKYLIFFRAIGTQYANVSWQAQACPVFVPVSPHRAGKVSRGVQGPEHYRRRRFLLRVRRAAFARIQDAVRRRFEEDAAAHSVGGRLPGVQP